VAEVFVISDGTGATAEMVVKAALTQFPDASVRLRRFGHIRTVEQIREIISRASQVGAPVCYTLVTLTLRREIMRAAQAHRVRVIDLMGPMMFELADVLHQSPSIRPGRFRQIAGEFSRLTDVMEFMLRHDDGKNPAGLSEADIVVVGVSRTAKTPICVYLAYRGWRAANVPIALGVDPPAELFSLSPWKIVGLTVSAERLVMLRRTRLKAMSREARHIRYADLDYVQAELSYADLIFRRPPRWPVVNVTDKSVEEAAVEIVELVRARQERAAAHAGN